MKDKHTFTLTDEQMNWLFFTLGYARGAMFERKEKDWEAKTTEVFETIRDQAYGTDKTGE